MKLKTLAAALAIASSGSAFAGVGTPVASSTGGEMLLSIFSQAGQATYQLDIGLLYADFVSQAFAKLPDSTSPYTISLTIDASTDAAFSSFINHIGAQSDVKYSFIGGDNSGVTAAARSMATTIRAGGDVTVITNGNLVDGMNSIANNYIDSGVNTKVGNVMAVNGSSWFTQAENNNGHYYKVDQTTLNGKFNIGNDNLVGTAADVYHFVRSSTSAGGNAIETKLGAFNVVKNSNTQYVVSFSTPLTTPVAVVPEPSSYALAIAGLGVVGLIARRRRVA
ncbi:MAG TPA: PEP-CTERM sorting domain-containing protein [Aquabacterium sp.]|uniref:PEP-CTERM sorting domain-containing protein n=1 Tax=Aquabacterium sp. TaxID=1872578 RepID=UPI002E343BAA|nr:PEP-CTERM sorting domain-containing protein [Aquabacterium sp.]HEX5373600.1 PEP-CTERM sorting domain-containing protein [Aquabacterium sp.]